MILFFVALFAFVLMPGNELRLDSIQQFVNADAKAGAQTAPETGAEDPSAPRFTPVPTPSPTPRPTPTPIPTPSPTPVPTPVPTPSPTPLVKGMRGEEIIKLQTALINLGFLEGTADGQYGSGTVTAVNNVKTYLNEQYAKTAPGQQLSTLAYFDEDGDGEDDGGASDDTAAESDQNGALYNLNGEADWELLETIYSGEISNTFEVLTDGMTGSAVKRVQSRLNSLGYIYQGVDGAFGATTKDALLYFQKLNGLPETGIADKNTQALLFSSGAVRNDKPLHEYKIVVDISEQRVYAYQWTEKNSNYSKLVKKFKCSTGARGTPTPTGTFDETVRLGERWHYFKDFGCWAQYAIHIDPTGNVMFHSVLFSKRGGRPTSGSVSALGRRASHGCIRLAVDDAKWMHEHVTNGTTIVIQK